MKNILQYLIDFGKSETIVTTEKKELNHGETWVYPVVLKKGEEYRINARCSGAATIQCSLFNGWEAAVSESEAGEKNSLSIIPEDDGLHKLQIMLQSASGDSRPQKVMMTIKKAIMPSYIRVWYDSL